MTNANILTADNINDFNAAQLAEWFRANVNKDFNRFSDLKTAKRRCLDALSTMGEQKPVSDSKELAPVEKTKAAKEPKVKKEKTAKPPKEKREPKPKVSRAKYASRSEGIAESWKDRRVRAERLTRNQCYVSFTTKDGEHSPEAAYSSVHEAFMALGLPMGKHIRFRKKLKADIKAVFEHTNGTVYKFHLAE